ncbi:Quinone oxidoreductase 1 [Pseudovibrio axinellae]|uniref:Quinone oxidoreductase 1 n=1 Tax=Pseudovibrio axinellae TaxID=989403 RepID=A0A165X3H1_9HYPH|nr:NADPH:quinone oxidoreductase family protein [Pseudovibrio axinellae]KZL17315.1 Quinone oxidoreductase 1 [Pseudovibrio axinellae]SEQ19941.1 NADPH2:quinone reductase [Pseudovibrio axinellae]
MKAVICEKLGSPNDLVVRELEAPSVGAGEVMVRVKAAALNYFDTLIIQGKYQFKPELPFSPGGELAGVVEAVGDGVSRFKVGDRVASYTKWGAARELFLAREHDCVRVPDEVPLEHAAGLLITYGTAIHGLRSRAHLQSGESVAVLGASGGAGQAAVEISKLMGARVIACASSEEKLAHAKACGADVLVNYTEGGFKQKLKDLTDGKGLDVVYDTIGGDHSENALRATAWRGRYLVVGFASGTIQRIPANLALLKGCDILGVFWGDAVVREPEEHHRDCAQLFEWVAQGKLKPHIHAQYSLEEIALGLEDITSRKAKGKVLLIP